VTSRHATLGAEVRLCAPGTLLTRGGRDLAVTVVHDFDEALAWADVVGLLRLQSERGSGAFVARPRWFTFTNGLTVERARLMKPEALIMHPGPMNRGVKSIRASSIRAARSVREANRVSNGVRPNGGVVPERRGSGEGQTL